MDAELSPYYCGIIKTVLQFRNAYPTASLFPSIILCGNENDVIIEWGSYKIGWFDMVYKTIIFSDGEILESPNDEELRAAISRRIKEIRNGSHKKTACD